MIDSRGISIIYALVTKSDCDIKNLGNIRSF